MLKLVSQKNWHNCCGQCTVATITGKPIEEVIELYGHKGASNMEEAKKVIQKIGGFKVGNFIRIDNRKKWKLPNLAMVRICVTTRTIGHFVAYENGVFYDPSTEKTFNSKEELLKEYNSGHYKWMFRHYLPIMRLETSEMSEASGNL